MILDQHDHSDRRAYPRLVPPQPLRAVVGAGEVLLASAVVEDISRGGVRLALDDAAVEPGTRQCVVRFHGSSRRVSPTTSRGWIRRATSADGHVYLAVEFTEPLVALDLGSPADSGRSLR